MCVWVWIINEREGNLRKLQKREECGQLVSASLHAAIQVSIKGTCKPICWLNGFAWKQLNVVLCVFYSSHHAGY